MLNVFPDTTAFRNDPSRRSPDWKTVERLAAREKLAIHISDICRREFVTYGEQEFDNQISAAKACVKKLGKACPIEKIYSKINEQLSEVMEQRVRIGDNLGEWLVKCNAQVHEVKDAHAKEVLDAYFEGRAPFSRVKSREDFPDAFIYQTILELANQSNPLNVITKDKNLSKWLAKIEGVVVHSTLKDFVQAHSLDKKLERTENLEVFIKSFIEQQESTQRNILANIEEQLNRHPVTNFDEEMEAVVSAPGSIKNFLLDADSVHDFGEGIFSIPFTAKSDCFIQYFLPKWVYHGLEDAYRPSSIEDWNDHMFLVEDAHELLMNGTITFEADPGALDGGHLRIDELSVILQNMVIEVEIESLVTTDDESVDALSY